MLQIAPDNELEQEVSGQDEIVCANCDHPITQAIWRISKNQDHEHTVFNPAGQVFRIVCFKEAPGVAVRGTPSTEFTWFKGYAWQVGQCAGCDIHIGWRFSGADIFFGLIKDRLKEVERAAD